MCSARKGPPPHGATARGLGDRLQLDSSWMLRPRVALAGGGGGQVEGCLLPSAWSGSSSWAAQSLQGPPCLPRLLLLDPWPPEDNRLSW